MNKLKKLPKYHLNTTWKSLDDYSEENKLETVAYIYLTEVLSLSKMKVKLATCSFWIKHGEDWFDRVIRTDGKCFSFNYEPKTKNTVHWAPVKTHQVILWKENIWGKGDGVGRHHRREVPARSLVRGMSQRSDVFNDAGDGHVARRPCRSHPKRVLAPARRCAIARNVSTSGDVLFGDKVWCSADLSQGSISAAVVGPDTTCLDFSCWFQAQDEVVRRESQTPDPRVSLRTSWKTAVSAPPTTSCGGWHATLVAEPNCAARNWVGILSICSEHKMKRMKMCFEWKCFEWKCAGFSSIFSIRIEISALNFQ